MDLVEEYWEYVPNFPEYVVSNYGHIRRTGQRSGRPLSRRIEDGAVVVYLNIGESEPRRFRLDRIVAAAFLGAMRHDMMQIDIEHIDNDPFNCKANNLRLVRRD